MRKYFVILLVLLIGIFVTTLGKGNTKMLSVREFKGLSLEKQAEYLNSLSKNEIIVFFKKFLPESHFSQPIDIEMKFLENGKLLIYETSYKYKKNEFFVSYWKIQDGKLILWKDNSRVLVPDEKYEEWDFFNAKADNKNVFPRGLRITFKLKTKEGNEDETDIVYFKSESYFFKKYYDEYLKYEKEKN